MSTAPRRNPPPLARAAPRPPKKRDAPRFRQSLGNLDSPPCAAALPSVAACATAAKNHSAATVDMYRQCAADKEAAIADRGMAKARRHRFWTEKTVAKATGAADIQTIEEALVSEVAEYEATLRRVDEEERRAAEDLEKIRQGPESGQMVEGREGFLQGGPKGPRGCPAEGRP